MNRMILHIDFDSYFASCEQHFDPNLRNKPIGVTAQNGRTCIIAASRQAKKYGIKTGTRTWEARKILKDIIFVEADFDRYLNITKKFIEICKKYSPVIEVFSIDEVFIDVTSTLHLYPSIEYIGKDIKRRIREEIGETITVSIGVSFNKLIAKLTSGLSKPDGFTIITRKDLPMLYKNTKLTDICGIGEGLERRLKYLHINTLKDLQNAPISILKKEFGSAMSFHLNKLAFLQDNSPVNPYTAPQIVKSVGRNYCLPQNEYNQTKILKIIYELCCEIGSKLRKMDRKGRTIGLYLAGEKTVSQEKTIGRCVNLDKDIFNVCHFLYKKWGWKYMTRQIHVWINNLTDEGYTPLCFLDNSKQDNVIKVMDRINQLYGDHTIRNGFLLYADKLSTKPNGFFTDKYERELLRDI